MTRFVDEPRRQACFGVPTFVINGELFWGREHLADIRALLANPSASHSDA
jgi:2-hydroxychromene-2-carboxylate isomerase